MSPCQFDLSIQLYVLFLSIAAQVIHPLYQTPISSLLADLERTSQQSTIRKTHVTSRSTSPMLDLSARTHLMSVVNCTPDSFSDGGESYLMEDAVRNSLDHLSAGADILDIGGMSTRPAANEVSVEEEIDRTIPIIQALREQHRVKCHISIDTFMAATARAAVQAGATIVNDVSGGDADPEMYSTIAQLDVPYMMMHMRGNPRTMSRLTDYADSDVVEGVRAELTDKVQRALKSGIKRWNIILDPGFGFAKDLKGNCQLLCSLDQLTAKLDRRGNRNPLNGFPLLVGLSRKTFLGQLASGDHRTSTDDNDRVQPNPMTSLPKDRLAPTIAASVMSILHGAHLVRVHDTRLMKDVLKTVDGIRFLGSTKDNCR